MSSVNTSSTDKIDPLMLASLLDSIENWKTKTPTDSQKLQSLITCVHGLMGAMYDNSKAPVTLEKQLASLAQTMERMKANLANKTSNEVEMKELTQNIADVSEKANVSVMTSLMQQAAPTSMSASTLSSTNVSVYQTHLSSSSSFSHVTKPSILSSSLGSSSTLSAYASVFIPSTLTTGLKPQANSTPNSAVLIASSASAQSSALSIATSAHASPSAYPSSSFLSSASAQFSTSCSAYSSAHKAFPAIASADDAETPVADVEAEELRLRELDNYVVNMTKFPTFSGAPKGPGTNSIVSKSKMHSSSLSQSASGFSLKTTSQPVEALSQPLDEADIKEFGSIDLEAQNEIENCITGYDLEEARIQLARIGDPDIRMIVLTKICKAFPDTANLEAQELAARRAADTAANTQYPGQTQAGLASLAAEVVTDALKFKASVEQALRTEDILALATLLFTNTEGIPALSSDLKIRDQCFKLLAKESLEIVFDLAKEYDLVAEDILCLNKYSEFNEIFTRWLDKLKTLQLKANGLPSKDRVQALLAFKQLLLQPRSEMGEPKNMDQEIAGGKSLMVCMGKRSTVLLQAIFNAQLIEDTAHAMDATIKEYEKPSKFSTWWELATAVHSELFFVHKSADKLVDNLKTNAFKLINAELQKALQVIEQDLIEAQKT